LFNNIKNVYISLKVYSKEKSCPLTQHSLGPCSFSVVFIYPSAKSKRCWKSNTGHKWAWVNNLTHFEIFFEVPELQGEKYRKCEWNDNDSETHSWL